MLENRPILKNLLWILIFLCVLFIGTLIFLSRFTRHKQDYILPDFSGLSLSEAHEVAKPLHLRLEVTDSLYIPDSPKGAIFRQVPPAGQHVKKNRRIELTINSVTPRQVIMPSLVGFSLRQAKAVLSSRGLQLGRLTYRPDMATNNVLAQRYKGRDIASGLQIDAFSDIDLELGVSVEHALAYVPSLKGKSLEAAKDIITDHCLNVGIIRYDASVQTGADTLSARVARQYPEYSSVPEWPLGTEVNITLTVDLELLKVEEFPVEETAATDTL